MFFKKLLFSILSFSFFLSCGDNGLFGNVNDGEGKNREFVDQRIANCNLEPDEFEYILDKEISSSINCLYNQLSFYMTLVEKADDSLESDNFSFAQLSQLIRNKYPEYVYLLPDFKFYFELVNFGVGNKRSDLLVKSDLNLLKEFLILFNKEAMVMNRLLNVYPQGYKISIAKHRSKKNELLRSARRITESLNKILDYRIKNNNSFSINEILTYFLSEDYSDTLGKILEFNFVKRMFLGGKDDIITRREFRVLSDQKLVPTLEVIYDFYRIKNIDLQEKDTKVVYQELFKHISSFENDLLYKGSDVKYYFNLDHIYAFLKTFGKSLLNYDFNKLNVEKYDSEILRIKQIFLANESRNFSYRDMSKLIRLVKDILKVGITFPDLYKHNEKRISRTDKLQENEIENILNAKDLSYYQDFKRVMLRYRYFKGNNVLPKFGDTYERNLSGAIQIAQFEKVLKPFIKFYRNNFDCKSIFYDNIRGFKGTSASFPNRYYVPQGYRCDKHPEYTTEVTISQVTVILTEYIQILADAGVMKVGEQEQGASNAVLMSDLFHYSSNGDGMIQLEEVTEFLLNLLSGTSIKTNAAKMIASPSFGCKVIDNIKEGDTRYPKEIRGAGKRYDAKCVRRNFYNLFKKVFSTKDGKYFDYFSKFKKYHDANIRDKSELKRFQLVVEKFTRSCAHENMPFSESDIFAVMAGMFAIESTIAKFDKSKTNQIDIDEAETAAFKHFEPALQKLNNALRFRVGSVMNLAEQAFWYILRNKKAPPSGLKAIGWAGNLWPKKVPADRFTLAAVLVALTSEGVKSTIKDIDCLNYCYNVNRKFTPDANKCRARLPKKVKLLSCQQWATDPVLKDVDRNDCDVPSRFSWDPSKIDETDTKECICN